MSAITIATKARSDPILPIDRMELAVRLCDVSKRGDLVEKICEVCPDMSLTRAIEVLKDPNMINDMWSAILATIVVPRLPNVVDRLMSKAETGDNKSIETILQVINKLQPATTNEAHLHVHGELAGMSTKALIERYTEGAEELRELAESLPDDGMGEIIDFSR